MRIKTLLILIFLVFSSLPAVAANMAEEVLGGDIKVRDDYAIVVDGQRVEPDVGPVEKGGVIFVPLRFAAEALHADVTWYQKDQTVVVVFPGGNTVKMKIGDPDINLGQTQKIMPVAPFLYGNRTMIPLRATAESGWYRVEEQNNTMILNQDRDKIKGYTESGVVSVTPGERAKNPLAPIIEKAHNDPVTKKLKPFVQIAWVIVGLLWLFRAALGAVRGKPDGWKDMIVIGLFLSAGMGLATHFMLSTYWVGIVILITSTVGIFSTEPYTEKLVTMASTAQGAGLICTLFGLGLLIGPAIAEHDIAAIGYGIYVKIEPTITGLALSLLMSLLIGYEARKQE